MLPNNKWIIEEIKKEIKKYVEKNENESMTIQNLWGSAKVALREKSIAIQAHLKKQEKSQINNLNLHLKQLEKEQQNTKLEIGRASCRERV